MENSIEEFEDALSLCDLPLYDQQIQSNTTNSPSTQDNFFEFSTTEANSNVGSILFCGKIIKTKVVDDNNDQRSNPSSKKMVIRSTSSSASSSPQRLKHFRCPSSGNSSKKHKVIIGLARIPTKMELSDLRERQNRRAPPPMFPTAVKGGETSVVSGNGSGQKSRNLGLLRPFRYRAQDLASTLVKSSSFGCLRLARPCID